MNKKKRNEWMLKSSSPCVWRESLAVNILYLLASDLYHGGPTSFALAISWDICSSFVKSEFALTFIHTFGVLTEGVTVEVIPMNSRLYGGLGTEHKAEL